MLLMGQKSAMTLVRANGSWQQRAAWCPQWPRAVGSHLPWWQLIRGAPTSDWQRNTEKRERETSIVLLISSWVIHFHVGASVLINTESLHVPLCSLKPVKNTRKLHSACGMSTNIFLFSSLFFLSWSLSSNSVFACNYLRLWMN